MDRLQVCFPASTDIAVRVAATSVEFVTPAAPARSAEPMSLACSQGRLPATRRLGPVGQRLARRRVAGALEAALGHAGRLAFMRLIPYPGDQADVVGFGHQWKSTLPL